MPRKKKIPRNDLGIPEYEMESLARILLPIMQEYLASEEGKEVSLELKGIGASPGKVTGKVRIIRNPANAKLEQGEILVAEYTDPGWIMLFPAASGILVERGSLLSHSAIVSRELEDIFTGMGFTVEDGTESSQNPPFEAR